MPFYDYECKNCNYYYEEIVKEAEKDQERCPYCGCLATRQITASVTIINSAEDGIVRRKKP